MEARCQCGRLSVALPGPTTAVVACHCTDCQRRSGSPFGVLAYYPADQLAISGEAKRFERPTATGGVFETFFCPECGSTVYAKAGKHPTLIGVAVGAIADPGFPPPVRSCGSRPCIAGSRFRARPSTSRKGGRKARVRPPRRPRDHWVAG